MSKLVMRPIAAILVASIFLRCATTTNEPEPLDSCQSQIDNFEAALNVYSDDPTNRSKCIAVKEAGAALLNCPSLTQSQKNDYKATLDAIYCN